MQINKSHHDDEPEINMIPMVDVILVLIIFFIVTATFDVRSMLEINLPHADGKPLQTKNEALNILISAEGRYVVGNQEVLRNDADSLRQTILEIAGDDRQRIVLLRADAQSRYQSMVTALNVLGQLGFRQISIATTTPEDGS